MGESSQFTSNDMTVAVDWDIKHQINQTKILILRNLNLKICRMSTKNIVSINGHLSLTEVLREKTQQKVSLRILNSGIILKTYTHVYQSDE